MIVVAIDPGSEQSAFVVWNGKNILNKGIMPNEDLLEWLEDFIDMNSLIAPTLPILAIEQIASLGMPVGASVFETVFWTGRFCQAWKAEFRRIKRHEIKMHFCQSMRAKDSNIRQALIDRFGPNPTKKDPNPVYGEHKLKRDEWQAWAVAVICFDQMKFKEVKR